MSYSLVARGVFLALACLLSAYAVPAAAEDATTTQAAAPDTVQQQPELVWQAGHTSPVNVVSFSPDGKLLASGSGTAGSRVEKNVVLLWDVATGTELRMFTHDKPVEWLAFSPDGRRLAARGAGKSAKARLWDIASGDELREEKVGPEYVNVTEIKDRKIAAAPDGNNVALLNMVNAERIRTFATRTSDFQKVMFSPDSTILACGGTRRSIRLWDLRSGTLRTLVGHTDYPIAADFSPDSRLFASGGRDLTVRVWDVASGREIHKLEGHQSLYVNGIRFSPDGKKLLSTDRAGLKMWDVATGRELLNVNGDISLEGDDVLFSPQGNLLAVDNEKDNILWDVETGKELRRIPTHDSYLFSPDGKIVATQSDEQVKFWDMKSGKELAAVDTTVPYVAKVPLEHAKYRFYYSAFSPDSQIFAASEIDYTTKDDPTFRLRLFEVRTGKVLHSVKMEGIRFRHTGPIVFTDDGKQVMNAGDIVAVWDVQSGEKVRSFEKGNTIVTYMGELWPLSPSYVLDALGVYCPLSANGKYYVQIGDSGELQLFDTETWGCIATLIGVDEQDWLVATDEGFFDGSPTAWKSMYWRFNYDTFNHAPLEAFFNEYYHPGLLPDVLAGNRPQPPDGKGMSRIDRRQPTVKFVGNGNGAANAGVSDRSITLTIEVEENASPTGREDLPATSGARDVRLFRNGSLVKAWRGDVFALGGRDGCEVLPSATPDGPRRARCSVNVPVVAGANAYAAYAFNSANVKSEDATISLVGAESLRRNPTLHVLAIGVNEYDFQPLNLKFAVADAKGFAGEIVRQQQALKTFASVDSTLLADSHATKREIMEAFTKLAVKAQPEDTVIVYFAGHGTAHKNRFYLIPHDIGYAEDRPDVIDDGLVELLRRSISDRELETAFEKVDAEKILFVIDACNSGQALEADEKRRGPMNSKGLAQLAYEKGMYVLTAAQSFQAAQEVSKLGHGLLTYVLVDEGLKRAVADCEPVDDRVDVREWLDYATRRVPQVQLHEMQVAQARGARLAFAEDELRLDVEKRTGQRPRAFYRRELDATPLVIAHTTLPTAERVALATEGEVENGGGPTRLRAKSRSVAVAIGDRTIKDQVLPDAVKEAWRTKISKLSEGDISFCRLVNDVAAAEWQLQVAALERTDVVYLSPAGTPNEAAYDDRFRMSPPGDAAIEWLGDQLKRISNLPPGAELLDDDGEQRSFLGVFRKGPAEDLKADIVEELNSYYHTPNSTQAIVGTYGKAIAGNRLLRKLPSFEQRGVVPQLDRIRRMETIHRQGKSSGKDFLSLFSSRQAWQVVDLGAKVSGGQQRDVSFEIVGVRLEQSDVIAALNADEDALNYFDYLQQKSEAACVVLENVFLKSYSASQTTNVGLGVSAQTAVTTDSAKAQMENERSSATEFASPVVRCYQMYQVKMNQGRVVELVGLNP